MNNKVKLRLLKKVPKDRRKEVMLFFDHIEKYHPLITLDVAIGYIVGQIRSRKERNMFSFYQSVPRWISNCYEDKFGINRELERSHRNQRLSDKLCIKKGMF